MLFLSELRGTWGGIGNVDTIKKGETIHEQEVVEILNTYADHCFSSTDEQVM